MFSLKIEADSPPLFLEKYYFNLKNSIKTVADSLAFLKRLPFKILFKWTNTAR